MKHIATFLLAYATVLLVTPAAHAQFERTDYVTGAGSFGAVFADLNGDGEADLAVSNIDAGNVTVLLGNGSGSFSEAPNSPFAAHTRPVDITAADFDGDGDLDLAVANNARVFATLLLNDGSGDFSTTKAIRQGQEGDHPDGIVSGDFDMDGDVDLAVTNRIDAGTLTILENDGSADFTQAARMHVGSLPRLLAAGDLDGDGDLDLAVPNKGSDNVSVLENTSASGMLSFSVAATVAVGDGPSGLAAADLDGDGDLDLATTNNVGGTISVLKNTGNFTFNATTGSMPCACGPFGIVAVNLDGNAHMDLAVANAGSDEGQGPGGDNVTFLLNDGAGAFNPYGTPQPVGDAPVVIAGTDLDGNGLADLATANFNSGNATVLNITSPLPVELASFEAVVEGADVVLSWRTASETGNTGFEVEHQRAGETFEKIGFVAGHGTTTEVQRYHYRAEELAPGTHFFRLRQVDIDGTASYSEVLEVHVTLPGAYRLTAAAPNPFSSRTRFTLWLDEAQEVQIALYDMLGRQVAVLHEGQLAGKHMYEFAIDGRGLASGIYLIHVAGEQFAETQSITFVK